MRIGEYMTSNVITVRSDTYIQKAQKLMQDHKIRRLPVVDEGKLVGIVTQDRIREATAAPLAFPITWEGRYLLSRTRVRDVMATNVLTVNPKTTVEDAITIGQARGIGALPVVTQDKSLLGMVTTTDLYNTMGNAIGFGQGGISIHVYECSKAGRPFGEVLDIINRQGIKIWSMIHVTPPGIGKEDCIIHLDANSSANATSEILGELKVKGYDVEARPSITAHYHNIIIRSEGEENHV